MTGSEHPEHPDGAARLDSLGVAAQVADRASQVQHAAAAARHLGIGSAAGVSAVLLDLPADASAPGSVGHAVAALTVGSAAVPVIAATEGAASWMGAGLLVVSADPATLAAARSRGASPIDLSSVPEHDSFAGGLAASLVVLDRLGLISETDDLLAEAVATLGPVVTERGQAAASLARRIGRTMPIVYGGGLTGAVAAARWKASVNRFAKAPSFANSVPGLDRDEVCGWGQHGDVTRQVMTLVTLRHSVESADEARRLDSTAETCEEIMAGVHEIRAGAGGAVAQLLELVTVGELVALEMAAIAGVDPGPLPVLDRY